MTYFEADEPRCERSNCQKSVTIDIIPRAVDLGGLTVQRILPSKDKKTVGPFVFWDQAGPGEFLSGHGLDVRPHPHICLTTMTYLFSGRLQHRDTLGSNQIIEPGDVNLMTAGSGIAHSERTPQEDRLHPQHFFGIQCWLALPKEMEEINPSFSHYTKFQIPSVNPDKQTHLRLITGEWEGIKSPVLTLNGALFIECTLGANAQMMIPNTTEERAIHILTGELLIDHINYKNGQMLILKTGTHIVIKAKTQTQLIILGGPALPERRYLWWNFVASSKERIEQAKEDWQNGSFGKIPGDDKEYIPLPK